MILCTFVDIYISSNFLQQISIHINPIDVIPRIVYKLHQKGPLGPAVPFAERMQVVGYTIKNDYPIYKLFVRQVLIIISFRQPAKNQSGLCLNALSRTKPSSFLADVYCTNLSSSII